MSHHPSLTDLIAYHRGELSQEQDAKLRTHLSGCEHCVQNLEMFSASPLGRERADLIHAATRKASMPCLSAEEISMFMNGELPKEEEREVQAHLANCENCRQQLAALIRASAPLPRSERAAVAAQSTLSVEQQLRAIERMTIQNQPLPTVKPQRSLAEGLLAPIFSLRPAAVFVLLALLAPIIWFAQKPFRHWRAESNLSQGLELLQKRHPIPDDALRPHGFPQSMFSVHHSSKELDEIRQKLHGALSWESENRDVKRALALLHFFNGDTATAERLLRNLVQEDERDYAAWNDLGFLAAQREDTLAALQAFERAVAVNPQYQEAADNLTLLRQEK